MGLADVSNAVPANYAHNSFKSYPDIKSNIPNGDLNGYLQNGIYTNGIIDDERNSTLYDNATNFNKEDPSKVVEHLAEELKFFSQNLEISLYKVSYEL